MKESIMIVMIFFLGFSIDIYGTMNIYTMNIPGLYQLDNDGVYDKALQAIMQENNKWQKHTYPPGRAKKKFETCIMCCYSPSNLSKDFYNWGNDIIQTDPINTAKAYLFSPYGSEPIKNLDQLKGKTIGLRHGMPYGKKFDSKKINKIYTTSIEISIRNLDNKRIDAFLAYAPDIFIVLKKMGKKPYPYDSHYPVAIHQDALVCRGVSRTYIQNFNKKLKSLRENGQLKNILGDFYLE